MKFLLSFVYNIATLMALWVSWGRELKWFNLRLLWISVKGGVELSLSLVDEKWVNGENFNGKFSRAADTKPEFILAKTSFWKYFRANSNHSTSLTKGCSCMTVKNLRLSLIFYPLAFLKFIISMYIIFILQFIQCQLFLRPFCIVFQMELWGLTRGKIIIVRPQ